MSASKQELKQQAKALLLKGCYKMAFNKYSRLIQMGSEGFTQRQWSVIHLNQAIALQFQQQYEKALESASRSIQIDPTYEKAHYRKMQILRQMGRMEEAVASAPLWIKNKEIDDLAKEIKEEYLNSMGMDQILENLLAKHNQNLQFAKDAHSKFLQRIIEALESDSQEKHLLAVGQKISKYYRHLKEENLVEVLESFLSKIHYILVKQKQTKSRLQAYKTLLKYFWQEFEQLAEPMTSNNLKQEAFSKEQYKLVKYAPPSQRLFSFFELLIMCDNIKRQDYFELAITTASNLLSHSLSEQQAQYIYGITSRFVMKVSEQLDRQTLSWIKRFLMLVDSLIQLHLAFHHTLSLQLHNITHFLYLHYFYINSTPDSFDLSTTPFRKLKSDQIITILSQNLQNFLFVYAFQHFMHLLDRNLLKQLIAPISEQLDLMRQLKKTVKKEKKSQQIQLQQQFVLLYSSILLKIDLKAQSTRINISSILRRTQNFSLSDLQINALLLLSISSKQNLIEILKNMDQVTQVISKFIESSFQQQIQSVKIVTSFLYLLVVDLEDEQEETFAKKMGTSVEEIRKARKIQGEASDPAIHKKLMSYQQKSKEFIVKNWIEIIPAYCELLSKIKDDISWVKWAKFLNQIGKIDHTRFLSHKIISFLLQSFKLEKKAVGQLLSIICKKVNVALLKYQHLQSITSILVDRVENSQQELIIFESLLGLINITSNSSSKVRIPIKVISNAVFEENKYIVHAACSLLNNLLALNEEEVGKQANLKDIVQKYISFYRQEIDNDQGLPLSDYSHPSRVYSTLLSLAMVLDLDQIKQFQDWSTLQACLLKIKTSRCDILYKSVWYMEMKGKLMGKWWARFEQDLSELQEMDYQRWLKLQQYIKR